MVCGNCGEEYPEDDFCSGCSYCTECCECKLNIHGADYRPRPKFWGDSPYYGVELEVEKPSGDVQSLLDYIIKTYGNEEQKLYLKEDGSLNRGFEIVTHPMSLKYHLVSFPWADLLKTLRESRCKSHETTTCGLHIHTDKSFLSKVEAYRLGIFINFNNEFFELQARRTSCQYSRMKKKGVNRLLDMCHSFDRYEAINFTPNSTNEFRLYRGTLIPETLFSSLELTDACLRFVKQTSVVKLISPNTIIEFVKFIHQGTYHYLPTYLKKTEKELSCV